MLAGDFATDARANKGSAAPHFSNVRLSSIYGLQFLDHVLAAMLVARARTIAGEIQIHADPAFVVDLLQDAMAGGEVDVAIAEVVDAFEELCLGGVALVDFAVGKGEVGLRRGPARV